MLLNSWRGMVSSSFSGKLQPVAESTGPVGKDRDSIHWRLKGAACAVGRTEGLAEAWVSWVQGEKTGRAGPLVSEGGGVLSQGWEDSPPF